MYLEDQQLKPVQFMSNNLHCTSNEAMRSIEIFDSKQMRWIPYIPDYDK